MLARMVVVDVDCFVPYSYCPHPSPWSPRTLGTPPLASGAPRQPETKNRNKREHVYPHIVPANNIVTQRSQRRVHVYPLIVPGNTCVPTYCTR